MLSTTGERQTRIRTRVGSHDITIPFKRAKLLFEEFRHHGKRNALLIDSLKEDVSKHLGLEEAFGVSFLEQGIPGLQK